MRLDLRLIKVNAVPTLWQWITFVQQFFGMKNLKGLSVLMGITILVITGFQLYWLRNTYVRENQNLEIASYQAFQETVDTLQVSKLHFKEGMSGEMSLGDSPNVVFRKVDIEKDTLKRASGKDIISMANAFRVKMLDSGVMHNKLRSSISIVIKQDSLPMKMNAGQMPVPGSPNHVLRYIISADSLQDSLRLPEINKAFTERLTKEKITIPFAIIRIDSMTDMRKSTDADVTVGLSHPISFHLELGNRIPYLLKKIIQPILFSIFLVAVTFLCFLLFYRNLRAQQRLTAIKNDFISNITHELKTPIATVSVAIEALKNFNALENPQRAQDYLDISGNELQRLSLLVDKVLKLSMFENRQITLSRESFDLVELTREVMASMQPQFDKQQAVTNLEKEGQQFIISADKLHMSSVIYNLLDNALKYSKEGTAKISVKIVDCKNYIELRVADNGIGIAPEYKHKIFEQFFRVPSGNRHNIKGYGLGLSYVNHIVKSHQGFIELESALNKGSEFIIKMPFAEADMVQYDKGRVIRKRTFKIG
jgi:two-component system, OmpR family, phosphate regulon sensor histidine kinase PhoR